MAILPRKPRPFAAQPSREAKATCAHSIQEAKTLCSMAIRDAETQGASQAGTFNLSQGSSSSEQVSAPVAPSPPAPEHSPRPKQQHPSPDPVDVSPPSGTMSKATPEGPPSSKWQ